jgi:hypothetical protein
MVIIVAEKTAATVMAVLVIPAVPAIMAGHLLID